MRKFFILTLFATNCISLFAQEAKQPSIKDLDFLIGTWAIEFDLYNAKKPEVGIESTEKGTQTCFYELPTNGEPMYITCNGEVTDENGRTRTFRESIRYSVFTNSFERTGLFSHWPSISQEMLSYQSDERKMTIQGTLGYNRGRIERFYDEYFFNENFTEYSRKHVTNLSDMKMTEFNVGLIGRAKKIK